MWRRKHRREAMQGQTMIEGRIPDGDTVLRPGQERWATLITRELPRVPLTPPMHPPADRPESDTIRLVRNYVAAAETAYEERSPGEYWWRGSTP
jgi:hypothetical protein